MLTPLDRELIRIEEIYQSITEDPKWNKKIVKLTLSLMKFVDTHDPHNKCVTSDYGLNLLGDASIVRHSSDRLPRNSDNFSDQESTSLMAYRNKSTSQKAARIRRSKVLSDHQVY